MNEVELFFVALYKHDAPQLIAAGPFFNPWDAQEKADELTQAGSYRHVVVQCAPLPIIEVFS